MGIVFRGPAVTFALYKAFTSLTLKTKNATFPIIDSMWSHQERSLVLSNIRTIRLTTITIL